jgi:hypothetical protein
MGAIINICKNDLLKLKGSPEKEQEPSSSPLLSRHLSQDLQKFNKNYFFFPLGHNPSF